MNVDSEKTMSFVRRNMVTVKNKLLNKHSEAESHFVRLLNKANIYYFREKCNFKMGTRWCYYDFYIPFFRIYVEIDGESHNNEEQRNIDAEKHQLVKNKQCYLARFTNEEVLAMESIDIGTIIDRVALQLRTKKHPRRDYKSRILRNIQRNYETSIADMRIDCGYPIDESRKVYLYDHSIGNYFEFRNVFEAKMNVRLSINAIYELLDSHEYKPSATRRYVFAWSMAELERRVAIVYE